MISISILFELSKWKQVASDKGLSAGALKKLTKSGVRKPATDHLAGFERGTQNILKKNKVTQNKSWNPRADWQHRELKSGIDHKSSMITVPMKRRDSGILGKRHESYEASEAKRKARKGIAGGTDSSVEYINRSKMKGDGDSSDGRIGRHKSVRLLKKESNDSKQLTGIYPHLKSHSSISPLKKYREKSGESKLQDLSGRKARKIDRKIEQKQKDASQEMRDSERIQKKLNTTNKRIEKVGMKKYELGQDDTKEENIRDRITSKYGEVYDKGKRAKEKLNTSMYL